MLLQRIAVLCVLFSGLLFQAKRTFEMNRSLQIGNRRDSNSTTISSGWAAKSVAENKCSLNDDSCLLPIALTMSRVWPVKPVDSWCGTSSNGNSSPGLFLVKVPKSASSTAASVVLRIQNILGCHTEWQHGRASELDYIVQRNVSHTFLVAPVRTASSRALSSIYYHRVSLAHRGRSHNSSGSLPKDSFIIKQLDQTKDSYIADYMTLQPHSTSTTTTTNNTATSTTSPVSSDAAVLVKKYVRDILDSYDFLMVADRMAESLVALALLTNLSLGTVVTASSKQGGSWRYHAGRDTCIRLATAEHTPAIRNHVQSDAWKRRHAADRLLYAAANHSLDRTIRSFLGEHDDSHFDFEAQLQRYWQLTHAVQQACANETHFPCSASGVPQLSKSATSCYVRDFGCGYPCIDRVVAAAQAADRHG